MNRLVPALVFAFLLGQGAVAQDYTVRLQRALNPGDEMQVFLMGRKTQSTVITVNGAKQKEARMELNAQLDGTEKVLAVDGNGKETKTEITVRRMTFAVNGGAPLEILLKGTVISCWVDGKKQVYFVDGKAVSADVAKVLDMVVDLSEGEPSKDEDFGATEQKKKGDTWDVNATAVKRALENGDSSYEFDHIAGKVSLDDVTDAGMKVSARFTGNVKLLPPPGFTIDKGTIDAAYTQLLPPETSKYQTGDSEEIVITFTAVPLTPGDKGKSVAKTTLEKSLTRNFAPAK
ncbi:MAG TPA: hypothetical protein VG733_14465 [Chthoniobacteraceae bacterium]|nr:hypothetical protein [Chthoniobacteraceae bacterium]